MTVLKAELHCHIEGMVPPAQIRALAARNGVALPDGLFTEDDTFAWTDFLSFLNAYDRSAEAAMRTAADYRDATYAYLAARARAGGIYNEFFISASHGEQVGLGYVEMVDGIADGIQKAEEEFGIVGRIVSTAVRHLGPEAAMETARLTVENPHPLVTGFGMGGDENQFSLSDFAPSFALAAEHGLGCTVHAGEVCGPQSVWDAINVLPVTRIGHGVRAIEDPALIKALADRGIVLEVCPGSNIALKVYETPDQHPLNRLRDAGVKVTLGSDDPPFFETDLETEYERGRDWFGLTDAELTDITRTAVQAAFVDEQTRSRLVARLT